MLRTLVLLLVIATPLLSQDLLVDFMDREFSGRLIEITYTNIYFQIHSATDTVQYEYWEVKRVTLADGRLAFEDGRTYVENPTLAVEPQPMAVEPEVGWPTPQPAFVPVTGEPIEEEPLQFDPETGELIPPTPTPVVTPEPAAGKTAWTEQRIIALARADARRRHQGWAWGMGGGLLGGGGMVGGGIYGLITTYSFSGILVGVAAGALTATIVLSFPPVSVPESPQLEDAAPGQRETYRQTFIGESRRLRTKSVLFGELVIASGGFLFLTFLFSQ